MRKLETNTSSSRAIPFDLGGLLTRLFWCRCFLYWAEGSFCSLDWQLDFTSQRADALLHAHSNSRKSSPYLADSRNPLILSDLHCYHSQWGKNRCCCMKHVRWECGSSTCCATTATTLRERGRCEGQQGQSEARTWIHLIPGIWKVLLLAGNSNCFRYFGLLKRCNVVCHLILTLSIFSKVHKKYTIRVYHRTIFCTKTAGHGTPIIVYHRISLALFA